MNKRQAVYRFAYLNKYLILKIVIISICWILCFICYENIKDVQDLEAFIPHEILGIAADAPIPQVRKAYRMLSREKHPDKNPDNPNAKVEFIKITKAYTILTDPVARENFLKFGNPDGGFGNFHVSIALPNSIKKAENQISVLIVFFLVVVVIIPGYFYSELN